MSGNAKPLADNAVININGIKVSIYFAPEEDPAIADRVINILCDSHLDNCCNL